jgi:quinol---cytochrome c reductase iron-sulfur subunit
LSSFWSSGGPKREAMRANRVGVVSFAISMAASVALIGVYIAGGNRLWEGILLALALGGLGSGVVAWTALVDPGERTETRTPPEADETPAGTDDEPPLENIVITRRTMLVRFAVGAGGTLAAALAIPTLSLGPTPGDSLYRTKWTEGARVVDANNRPMRPEDLQLEGVLTVFPEGEVGSEDSQTQLLRVDERLLQLPDDRLEWAPQGCVGYSKICTHAGCPVGLYRAEAHQLLCPCHQSTFDVLHGAKPVFGPAVRSLPQLPLGIDDEGYLIALSDYTEPVGPSFWNLDA